MIKLTHKLPDNDKFFLALSGGRDSMAALHWLYMGGRLSHYVLHVCHNTTHSFRARTFVTHFCKVNNYKLKVINVVGTPPKGTSKEAWWREKRLEAFKGIIEETGKNYPIITGHNLDDCVEQFVLNTLVRNRLDEKYISYTGPSNVIRPFRTWSRKDINLYIQHNNITYVEDSSNADTTFKRNKIRHDILPKILELNPGFYNYVRKLILKDNEQKHDTLNFKQKLELSS